MTVISIDWFENHILIYCCISFRNRLNNFITSIYHAYLLSVRSLAVRDLTEEKLREGRIIERGRRPLRVEYAHILDYYSFFILWTFYHFIIFIISMTTTWKGTATNAARFVETIIKRLRCMSLQVIQTWRHTIWQDDRESSNGQGPNIKFFKLFSSYSLVIPEDKNII